MVVTVYLDGVLINETDIDPSKHTFVGIFRPPTPPMLSGNIQCGCGEILYSMFSICSHWMKGHMDVPQYQTIQDQQNKKEIYNMSILKEFEKEIADNAGAWGVDMDLVKAIILTESSGLPWSFKYEPNFYKKYIASMKLSPSQGVLRSLSMGLMQVMGQKAVEMGCNPDALPKLFDPVTNIFYGCKLLHNLFEKYKTIENVVAAYNAGSPTKTATGKYENQDYVDKVLKNLKKVKSEIKIN